MKHAILYSCAQTLNRYELYLPNYKQWHKHELNHSLACTKLNKIVLQTNSKAIIHNVDQYARYACAIAAMSAQTPSQIKTKQSISSFKMIQNTTCGALVTLRHDKKIMFCYKWSFLSPAAAKWCYNASATVAVTNMFGFELDVWDYETFESIAGCTLHSSFNNVPCHKLYKSNT